MYRQFSEMASAAQQSNYICGCTTKEQHSGTLHLVTGNPGKLAEFTAIMGKEFEGKIVTVDIDLPEYQGEIDEIAIMKCKTAFANLQGPVLIEDSSLCYNAMHGLPGPYIKWFLKSCGTDGLERMLHGFEDKSARAVCAFSLMLSDTEGEQRKCQLPASAHAEFKDGVYLLRGETDGEIVKPRGKTGFGWDPIFQPAGHNLTYAEMPAAQKNAISQRSKGLALLRDFLVLNTDKL